jgi:hypothetical protein
MQQISLSSSQESIQNQAEALSPIWTVTGAWNIRSTLLSGLDGSSAQTASSWDRRSHSQRSRRAKPSTLRSGNPNPPWSLGEQTTG